MKKPKVAIDVARNMGPYPIGGTMDAILAYLDSIPDDAHICVWPKEATKERLLDAANALGLSDWGDLEEALRALAAIAPEAPKKRMMNAWKHRDASPALFPLDWTGDAEGWRKIGGPFEIEE